MISSSQVKSSCSVSTLVQSLNQFNFKTLNFKDEFNKHDHCQFKDGVIQILYFGARAPFGFSHLIERDCIFQSLIEIH